MPWWIVIKTGAKTAWSFIRKYWQIFAGAIGMLVVMLLMRGKENPPVGELWNRADDDHKKPMGDLEAQNRKQLERIKRYAEVEAELRKKLDDDKLKLDKEAKEMIDNHGDKPINEIAKELAEKTGWHVGS